MSVGDDPLTGRAAPPQPRLSGPARLPDPVWSATAAVALALWVQSRLDLHPALTLGALALGVLLPAAAMTALWWRSLRADAFDPVDPPMPVIDGPAMDRTRQRAAAAGLGLLALTTIVAPLFAGRAWGQLALLRYPLGMGSRENTFTPLGTALWLFGLVLYLRAVVDAAAVSPRAWLRERWTEEGLRVTVGRMALAVAAVALVGAIYRFHDLASVPREMTSDHVEKLIDINDLVHGTYRAFFWRNTGREMFQFYWTALFVWFLGLPVTFLTQKLAMATLSVIALTFTYQLGRRVAGPLAGLSAALVLALCPWDVQITRVALRYELSAVFAGLTLWLLFRALQQGTRNSWLVLGAGVAVGLHGYTGFRPILLAIAVVIALRLGYDRRARRRLGLDPAPLVPRALLGHLAATSGLGAFLLAPLLRYAWDQPALFFERVLTRTSGVEAALANPPLVQFAINMKNALLMFNYSTDGAWLVNPAGRIALETVGGALFLLGFLVALRRALSGDWRSAALLATVPIMLSAAAMSLAFPNEVPHLARSAGALPAVAVLVALPLPFLAARWRSAYGSAGLAVFAVLAFALFAGMANNTWRRYFGEYRTNYNNSSRNTDEGAAVAAGFVAMGGDIDHVYLVGWSDGWDYRAIGLLLGDFDYNGLLWGAQADGSDAVKAADAHVTDPAGKLYLVAGPKAEANVAYLRNLYAASTVVVTEHPRREVGEPFVSVFVPARR